MSAGELRQRAAELSREIDRIKSEAAGGQARPDLALRPQPQTLRQTAEQLDSELAALKERNPNSNPNPNSNSNPNPNPSRSGATRRWPATAAGAAAVLVLVLVLAAAVVLVLVAGAGAEAEAEAGVGCRPLGPSRAAGSPRRAVTPTPPMPPKAR